MIGAMESVGLHLPFAAESLGTLNDYTFWATADKAIRELGWKLRPLEDTLREVLNDEMKRLGMKPPAPQPA
jgi:hypothetical protein